MYFVLSKVILGKYSNTGFFLAFLRDVKVCMTCDKTSTCSGEPVLYQSFKNKKFLLWLLFLEMKTMR